MEDRDRRSHPAPSRPVPSDRWAGATDITLRAQPVRVKVAASSGWESRPQRGRFVRFGADYPAAFSRAYAPDQYPITGFA